MNYNLEICAFNIKDCIDISKFDISRIELCTNKKKGGLTPSKNSIIKSLKLNIPIHPIIRPRGGNFLYNKTELRQMIESIKFCKNIGCHGVVFGILDKKNKVNIEMCKKLKTLCGNMSTTFHRAFDEIADPFDALESIIDLIESFICGNGFLGFPQSIPSLSLTRALILGKYSCLNRLCINLDAFFCAVRAFCISLFLNEFQMST